VLGSDQKSDCKEEIDRITSSQSDHRLD